MARIVVGVDPWAAGSAALHWALREAVACRLPLVAVGAWHAPALGMYHPPGGAPAEGDLGGCAQAQLLVDEQLKLAREHVAGADTVDAQATAVMGAPAQVLIDAGRDAAMVVVGTRGRGGLSRATLGSVSSSVLHHAASPVVFVPDSHDMPRGRSRVLVGVDQSPESLTALRFAVQEAQRSEAMLVPVFVHDLDWSTPRDPGGLERLRLGERHALISAAAAAGATSLHVEPVVVRGQPGTALPGWLIRRTCWSWVHAAGAGSPGSCSARRAHNAPNTPPARWLLSAAPCPDFRRSQTRERMIGDVRAGSPTPVHAAAT